MPTPIKRHTSLQPLSRDHHEGLLLSWKIRKGIAFGIELDRIQNYVDWFFVNHLLPHFSIEEEKLFPIVGSDNASVKQALVEHFQLVQLLKVEKKDKETLIKIADLLEAHIRFEERVLFNEVQAVATEDQLKEIESLHTSDRFCENKLDEFWVVS